MYAAIPALAANLLVSALLTAFSGDGACSGRMLRVKSDTTAIASAPECKHVSLLPSSGDDNPSKLQHPEAESLMRMRASATRAAGRRLKRTVRGEVRFDDGSRALYATDASNYRQVPIGLVIPRDLADVEATVAACRAVGAPILARGGGTSLSGQCCNVAVILDFSKYLNKIVSLDPGSKRARVEPGIVLDRVRDAAELHHLTFAPDPATHSRCTIGGMIGNNSCGVHALLGGKTVDNVESLDILLYDGTKLTVGATGEEELRSIIAAGGRRGQIYSSLAKLRDRYADLIRRRFPRIPRRVSGYNLDELLPENGFHVARSLVGSEGTCVTMLGRESAADRQPAASAAGRRWAFPIPSSPPIMCRRCSVQTDRA
jgi:hypothetical protein